METELLAMFAQAPALVVIVWLVLKQQQNIQLKITYKKA